MSNTTVPVPAELPYPLTLTHVQALSQLLHCYEAETAVDMLQQLFRGWMASEEVPDDPEQRGIFYHDYERLLKCFQQMMLPSEPAVKSAV